LNKSLSETKMLSFKSIYISKCIFALITNSFSVNLDLETKTEIRPP
jgi:hypothetical protein